MSRFFEWTADDKPGVVHPIRGDTDWDNLRHFYAPLRESDPLDRIIEIAKGHNVRAVVVERRYIDLDYRDEHSRFYSTTFLRYPSVCHRLHFLTREPKRLVDLEGMQDAYIGYSVMRPLPSHPVGRTMIAPPVEMAATTKCSAVDEVHIFGRSFEVIGMPFVSQDWSDLSSTDT